MKGKEKQAILKARIVRETGVHFRNKTVAYACLNKMKEAIEKRWGKEDHGE